MGIPYSKQINSAFDQVTPLVAAGFEVLQTTKNISILLAAIQVVTVIILSITLAVLVALLITMNPDLQEERKVLVTPVVKWFACWVMPGCEARGKLPMFLLVLGLVIFAGGWVVYSQSTDVKEIAAEKVVQRGEDGKNGGQDDAGKK